MSLWTDDRVALPPIEAPIIGRQAIQSWLERNLEEAGDYQIIECAHDFDEVKVLVSLTSSTWAAYLYSVESFFWGGAYMSHNAIPEIGIRQIDVILQYLPIFERGDFQPGQWVIPEGQIPYFAPSPEVEGFVQSLYQQNIIIPFDWTSWSEEAKRYQSDPDALETSDLLTLRKLLTTHVRADRFVEGHLAGLFQSGHVSALLRRLKRIRDSLASGS